MLESFPTGFKMHHQTKVPGNPGLVDLKGWSLYEDARILHANYWIGVAKREPESAMHDGQLALKKYQGCIDHLNASKHDPAFMKQVEADYDKLAMLMKRINEQKVQ